MSGVESRPIGCTTHGLQNIGTHFDTSIGDYMLSEAWKAISEALAVTPTRTTCRGFGRRTHLLIQT